MLKTSVLHPEILSALGSAGHLAQVLITDGNYPHNTRVNPRAKIVYANFMPGVISGPQALTMICDLVPIEIVTLMAPARSGLYAMKNDPPIWKEYRSILNKSGFTQKWDAVQKPKFNDLARSEDTCLVLATAETAIYANILLTIGVVR